MLKIKTAIVGYGRPEKLRLKIVDAIKAKRQSELDVKVEAAMAAARGAEEAARALEGPRSGGLFGFF